MAPMPVPPDDGGDDHVSGLPQGLATERCGRDRRPQARWRRRGLAQGGLGDCVRGEGGRRRIAACRCHRGRRRKLRFGAAGTAHRCAVRRNRPHASSQAARCLQSHADAAGARCAHSARHAAAMLHRVPPRRRCRRRRAVVLRRPRIGRSAWATRRPRPQRRPCRTPPRRRACEPLTSALDAAVRLAADASVAAEALENLKRYAGAQAAAGKPAAAASLPVPRLPQLRTTATTRSAPVPACASAAAAAAAPCRAGRRRRPRCFRRHRGGARTRTARAPRLRRARLHGGLCAVVGVRRRALSLHDGRLSRAERSAAPHSFSEWRRGQNPRYLFRLPGRMPMCLQMIDSMISSAPPPMEPSRVSR